MNDQLLPSMASRVQLVTMMASRVIPNVYTTPGITVQLETPRIGQPTVPSRLFLLRKMFIVSTLTNIKYLRDQGISYNGMCDFLRNPVMDWNGHRPSTVDSETDDYAIVTMFSRVELKLFLWFWQKTAAEQRNQRAILHTYQPPHRMGLFLQSSPAFKGITWKGTFKSYADLSASCKALRAIVGHQLLRWYKDLVNSSTSTGGLSMLRTLEHIINVLARKCTNMMTDKIVAGRIASLAPTLCLPQWTMEADFTANVFVHDE